jgi:hypothetical protein
MVNRPPVNDTQNQWTTAQVTVTVRFVSPTRAAEAVPASKRLDIPAADTVNIDHFTGLTWLLPPLLDWLEHDDRRIFLLVGSPGTGKSLIIAWLAGAGPLPVDPQAERQLEHIRSRAKATYYFVVASGKTSPKAFAQNVAEQLTRNVKGFRDALVATLGHKVQITINQDVNIVESGASVTDVNISRLDLGDLSDEFSFNQTLREPLKRLYEEGGNEPIVILVDALDEALTYTGNTNIVQLLAKLTDLPAPVRFIVTTRPDPRVLMHFSDSRYLNLTADASPEIDLKILVWLGRKHEALASARLRTEAQERFRGLLGIYDALRESEQADNDLLTEVEEVVGAIPDYGERTEALRDLGAALARAGHFAQSEETARAITDDRLRAEALSKLAVALAQAQQFAQAEKTVRTIPDYRERAKALRDLAAALAWAGQFAQAEETVSAITDDRLRAEALSNLTAVLAQAGHIARAEEMARAITDDVERAVALRKLAVALAQAGESRASEVFAQADETARAITDDVERAVALRKLAVALAQAGESRANEVFARAEETARSITDDGLRAWLLSKLAVALAQAGESRANEVFAQA